jgi:hypothetical protein
MTLPLKRLCNPRGQIIEGAGSDIPEKIPNEDIAEKTARPELLPIPPAIPKPQPVELEFDEADALSRKRTDV